MDGYREVNSQALRLSVHPETGPSSQELDGQGWRSVSMVLIPYICVLVANEDCPEFLRNKAGRVRMKWQHPVGWFDPQ
ncbi:hypothetical protein ELH43_36890 [Rhizobium ruizarguesonis]|uniref:DUF1780 domain-containing protein n=1 Tax=Rhizobium ruizarguesonis TaxID=2081791 RepID=UPI00102FF42A|nr:hypothetical protein ELH43_36890 [Rhizobium ruizarguesonis]